MKQIARENIKINEKELNEKLAKKLINPYYFIDENLKTGFKINLISHNFNHANFLLTIIPHCPDFGTEIRYINKTMKEMATLYARLMNQYENKHHKLFSASFDMINEEDRRSDETELVIDLNINHNLTESDNNDIDLKNQLEHQIQSQETKDSAWSFDKINSMKLKFYKTGEINSSNYFKLPLRSNAILNIKKMMINSVLFGQY